MAESLGKAVLELAGDLSGLRRDLSKAEGETTKSAKGMGDKFKSGLKSAMVPAIAVLGAAGVAAKKTVDAASDLGEQINKTSVVFGKSAPEIQKWSKGTASAIGISQRAALEAAGVFGNMLVPMGFARGKAADMSKSMVNLAADMASFNNADPTEVLDALRAGLAGETEPLRRFGVFLNDARLKQEAMNLGLYNGKGPLDAQAKAQATYALILKDTKDAQGDFAKTSTSAANAARIQAAESENLNAKIGKGLLPVYQQLQQILLGVTGFISQHTGATKIAVATIVALATAVLAVNAGMKLYAAGAAVVTAAQWLWNTALYGFPLVWIIAAIAAVIAIVVLAIKHWDQIKAVTIAVWNAIKSAVTTAATAVWNVIKGRWEDAKSVTTSVWNAIKGVISAVVGAIKTAIRTYFDAYESIVKGAWNGVKSVTTGAWNAIKGAVSDGVGAVTGFVRGIPGKFRDALDGLAGLLRGIGDKALDAFKGGVSSAAGGAVDFVKGLPGKLKNALGSLGGLLVGEGRALIQGLASGIMSELNGLLDKVKGIAGKIKSLKGPIEKDRVLLVDEGKAIIEGLGVGIDSEFRRLQQDVAGYAPTIQATFASGRMDDAASGRFTRSDSSSGPLVNIEHLEVRDAFDEAKLASDLSWKLRTA